MGFYKRKFISSNKNMCGKIKGLYLFQCFYKLIKGKSKLMLKLKFEL